jgi:hypothetical protein
MQEPLRKFCAAVVDAVRSDVAREPRSVRPTVRESENWSLVTIQSVSQRQIERASMASVGAAERLGHSDHIIPWFRE